MKKTIDPRIEVLFELRVVRAGGKINLEWSIPEPPDKTERVRRAAEIAGHLRAILRQLERDLESTWSNAEEPGRRVADVKYIG